MREAMEAALKVSVDGNDLRKALREQGYELDADPAHKYATLRRIGSKQAVRLYRLGEAYDLPAIRERIEENRQRYARDYSYHRYRPSPSSGSGPDACGWTALSAVCGRSAASVGCTSTTAIAWASCTKTAPADHSPRNCGRSAAAWTPSAGRRS